MRSFIVALCCSFVMGVAGTAMAQMNETLADDGGSTNNTMSDAEVPFAGDDEAAPAPQESSDMVMDEEMAPNKKAVGAKKVDFMGLLAPALWNERNGLGAHLGLGGMTCMRDYCDSTIDTKLFGSAAGTVGAYYRFNPNLSLFVDTIFAYMNTNFSQLATGGTSSDKDGAFYFSALAGANFHLPVKGWLDLYGGGGLGFTMLRAKAETSSDIYRHHFGGIDIAVQLGADFYFFSEGALKDLSIGPFMRLGFPIWPRLCVEEYGQESCGRPSSHDERAIYLWDKTPFTFGAGFEARWDFGLEFGSGGSSMKMEMDANVGAGKSDKSSKATDQPPPSDADLDF